MTDYKKDFPIFQSNKNLSYLDSAATSQKPQVVIDAISDYYSNHNSNIHRGLYSLSERSTQLYDEARKQVADFINADEDEIIFVRNATEAINLVAYSYGQLLNEKDTIILSPLEHHANIVPWQQLKERKSINVDYLALNENKVIDNEDLGKKLDSKPSLIAITHISNALGVINDAKNICHATHQAGSKILIDGSQSAPHMKVDVKDMDADFFVFTGHKVLAPTGIGVLYVKKEILDDMPPFLTGGDIINEVTSNHTSFLPAPQLFEAGTPNISGAIALSTAIKYLEGIGMDNVEQRSNELAELARNNLQKIQGIKLHGSNEQELRSSILSFTMDDAHPHDIAQVLANSNICIRAGHHCAQPLMTYLEINSTARASFHIYNDEEDVENLLRGIREVKKLFSSS